MGELPDANFWLAHNVVALHPENRSRVWESPPPREFPVAYKINLQPMQSAFHQYQRDCALQPKVARDELPWVTERPVFNPNGVVAGDSECAATPLGLWADSAVSQGSSFLATLGFVTESLWDSAWEFST